MWLSRVVTAPSFGGAGMWLSRVVTSAAISGSSVLLMKTPLCQS